MAAARSTLRAPRSSLYIHLQNPFFQIEYSGSQFFFSLLVGSCVLLTEAIQLIFLLQIIFFQLPVTLEKLFGFRRLEVTQEVISCVVINDKFEVNYTAFLRFMIDCFFQTLQCFCNCIFIFPCFF